MESIDDSRLEEIANPLTEEVVLEIFGDMTFVFKNLEGNYSCVSVFTNGLTDCPASLTNTWVFSMAKMALEEIIMKGDDPSVASVAYDFTEAGGKYTGFHFSFGDPDRGVQPGSMFLLQR